MKSQDTQTKTQTGEHDKVSIHSKEFRPGAELISRLFELDTIFTGGGSTEIFTIIAKGAKKNSYIIEVLGTGKRRTIFLKRGYQSLENFYIPIENSNDKWSLTQVFDSLSVRFNMSEACLETSGMTLQQAMDIMCPNHNKELFKEYHAKKIIKWYNQLVKSCEADAIKEENTEQE